MIKIKVQNKNNSSIKTKRIIKETFVNLINEKKDLNNITVTELVKKANINRSTFYTHYDSIYDIAEEFETETINLLTNDNQNTNNLNEYFDKIFYHLKENESTYKMLLSSDIPSMSLNKLNKLLNEKIKNFLGENKIDNSDINISFFVDGLMSLVLKYFKGKIPYTLEEINKNAKLLFDMLFSIK